VVKAAQGALLRHASGVYLGAIAAVTGAFVAAAGAYARYAGGGAPATVVGALFALLPASDVAIMCVQRVLAHLVHPKRLPRLHFSTGQPGRARALGRCPPT